MKKIFNLFIFVTFQSFCSDPSDEEFLKLLLSDPNLFFDTTENKFEYPTDQKSVPPYKTAEEEFKIIKEKATNTGNPLPPRQAALIAKNLMKKITNQAEEADDSESCVDDLKKYKCPHTGCNNTYSYHLLLSNHVAQKHSNEKQFTCPEPGCDKKFAALSSLKFHKILHSPEKCFDCPVCPRKCVNQSTLEKHIRVHTKEKPFKCSECESSFSQKGNGNMHIRNFHEGVGNLIDTRNQQDPIV